MSVCSGSISTGGTRVPISFERVLRVSLVMLTSAGGLEWRASANSTLNPKPQTLFSKSQTLNPKPFYQQALNPETPKP